MSQPKEYRPGQLDPFDYPIESTDDLVQIFKNAEKPRSEFRVGLEHERFVFLLKEQCVLPYEGEKSVESFLNQLADNESATWTKVLESGHTVALMGQGESVTLEPGGQIELSGAPLKTIHEIHHELLVYEDRLDKVAQYMGVGFILNGFHPWAKQGDFSWVPKERYEIMRRYMPKVGSRGLDMMLRTCTVQANLDYENEADMVSSVRTALALAPLSTLLFAASPFKEGRLTGWLSERTAVWQDTDKNRSGFLGGVFDSDFGYEKWVQFALDVPMYFIRRDGRYIDQTGTSFRNFMTHGFEGNQATVRDFWDHLTTIFTEVRLKPYIELRSADCGPWSHLRALPAFWKGLLYDATSKKEAFELMDNPNEVELQNLQIDVAQKGFKARYRGQDIGDIIDQVLPLATKGLPEDERKFLHPLLEIANRRETFAEAMIRVTSVV